MEWKRRPESSESRSHRRSICGSNVSGGECPVFTRADLLKNRLIFGRFQGMLIARNAFQRKGEKQMNKIGNLIGVAGIAVCIFGVAGRFINYSTIFGFQAINIFIVGVGLLVVGCFAKLSGR